MSLTYEQAVDDILALFKTAWDAGATNPTLVDYPNVAPVVKLPPDTNLSWARVSILHATGRQATLSGASGMSCYERTGTVTVQVFVPVGEGLSEAYQLARVASDAFEGKTTANNVWFRDVRVNEVGPDDGWHQMNVLADFMYDEVK